MPVPGRERGQIASRLDGRHGELDPAVVNAWARRLASLMDLTDVDKLVGVPEGGVVPAFAVASMTGLPLVLASSFDNGRRTIDFLEEHATGPQRVKRIFGLDPGERVALIEDEVSAGRTALNCVRALAQAGVMCDQVGTFVAIDHPDTHARFAEAGVRLMAVRWLPASTLDELFGRT